MTPTLFLVVLFSLLLLSLLFFLRRRTYGSAPVTGGGQITETGPKGGDGEGDAGTTNSGPGKP